MKTIRKLLVAFFDGCSFICHKAECFFTALAAGVFDLADWKDTEKEVWDQDTLYLLQELPIVLSGLMAWEIPILKYMKPGGTVGVIGCGAGRDMIAFAKEGFVVEGVDISDRAINAAKKFLADAGIEGKVYVGDMAHFIFPGPQYDAFVFSWFTYMLIFPRNNRLLALNNLHSKLTPGGCVILTFKPFYGEGKRMAQLAHGFGKLLGNSNPPVVGDCFGRNGYFQHFFTRQEIEDEARDAGFEIDVYREDRQTIAVLKKIIQR